MNFNNLVGAEIDWRDDSREFITVKDREWGEIIFTNTDQGPIGLIDETAGYWHGQETRESWITVLFNLTTGEYTIEDSTPWEGPSDLDAYTFEDVEYTIKQCQQLYGTTWNSLKFHTQMVAVA